VCNMYINVCACVKVLSLLQIFKIGEYLFVCQLADHRLTNIVICADVFEHDAVICY